MKKIIVCGLLAMFSAGQATHEFIAVPKKTKKKSIATLKEQVMQQTADVLHQTALLVQGVGKLQEKLVCHADSSARTDNREQLEKAEKSGNELMSLVQESHELVQSALRLAAT